MLFKTLLLLFCLLQFASEAKAQFVWEVTRPYQDSAYVYSATSLDCDGDNCTAGGLMHLKSATLDWSMVFFHSTDGGKNWTIQNPQLDKLYGHIENQFLRIQQIDSLNVVAVGDSGLIMRTYDAGVTWHKQSYYKELKHLISGAHFSDSLNGILTGYGANSVVMTTSDGGRNWNRVTKISSEEFIDCYAFGDGKYALLGAGEGPLSVTTDNFQTIQTINLVDYFQDSTWEYIDMKGCLFLSEDTIIAYGGYRYQADYGYIIRSTDRGSTWSLPYTPPGMWAVSHMTRPKGDTILAAGLPDDGVHISTDRGVTWHRDSLIHNSDAPAYVCHGIAWAKNDPVAIFTGFPLLGYPSDIFIGIRQQTGVESGGLLSYDHRIFPNPATSIINIASIEEGTLYQIYDILGRQVMSGKVLDQAALSVDVSGLPRGVYYVFVGDARDGHPVMVGKLSLVW
jgi:hypothetical protein